MKKLSLTIGITTCYGEDSILDTVKSVKSSRGLMPFRFIIIADRTPINNKLKKALKKYGVKLIENKFESSLSTKQKQILNLCQSDLIIFLQDDILLEKNTLAKVVSEFESDSKLTMISILNQPVKPTNFLEAILNVGTEIANRFAKNWNNGDNQLSVIGRFMAFKTKWVKTFNIPDSISTLDAFYYLHNKKLNGSYKYLSEIGVLFKNPQNLKEHLRKSSRFQYAKEELEHYFGSLDKEYSVPIFVVLKSLIQQSIKNPIMFVFYLNVFLYTKLCRLDSKIVLDPLWEVDKSTKKLLVQA